MHLSRALPTHHQFLISLVFGVVLGVVVVRVDTIIRDIFFSSPSLPSQTEVATPSRSPWAHYEVYSCIPATLGYRAVTKSPVTLRAVPKRVPAKPLSLPPVPKHADKPNTVRIHISQAPLPVSAKRVNGQWVCAVKNDKPKKSDKYKKGHIDRQCCLDPDEIPNPYCNYSYKS